MDDTITLIVAIGIGVIIILGLPLIATADRTDDVSQLAVQTEVTKFVDTVRTTGKLTMDDYDKMYQAIASTGNSFDVELVASILDENIGIKPAQAEMTKIGENLYYVEYTTQILDELNDKNKKAFKEGDMFAVTVKNTNKTISQLLKGFFYRLSGDDTYQIAAQKSGIVTVNGSK